MSREMIYRSHNLKDFHARKGMYFHCFQNEREIALIDANNIRNGMNTNNLDVLLLVGKSRFSLTPDSKCIYIWRNSGMPNLPSNITESDSFDSTGVMVREAIAQSIIIPIIRTVWGITVHGHTPLYVCSNGSVIG